MGSPLAVYIPVTKKAEEPDEDEDEEETFWILKKFTVFNADQVNGANAEKFQAIETVGDVPSRLRACRRIDRKERGGNPLWRRQCILSPADARALGPITTMATTSKSRTKSSFVNGSYYPTILHELGHWSEVRVGWDREKRRYAMGELIAEIASCFLATELGIPNGEPLENHAAYLKSWLEGMHNDPNFIFKATRQASKVCDFLLSFVRQSRDRTHARIGRGGINCRPRHKVSGKDR